MVEWSQSGVRNVDAVAVIAAVVGTLLAVVSVSCGLDINETATYPRCGEDWSSGIDPSCATHPHLCGASVSRLDDSTVPDDEAIRIAFVGDGFHEQSRDPDEMTASFRRRVGHLVDGLYDDEHSIVAQRPDHFQFYRIDLGPGPEGSGGSLLGGCIDDSGARSRLRSRSDLARFAAEQNLSVDPHVVVILLNSDEGRANAQRRSNIERTHLTRIRTGHSHQVLDHELGHALIGLGDEYSDRWGAKEGECYECDDFCRTDKFHGPEASVLANVPNLTIDEQGTRWEGLVDGAEPGGWGYDCGIYHPGESCRMKSSSTQGYCRVCRAAIQRRLNSFVGGRTTPPDCRVVARTPLPETDWDGEKWIEVDVSTLAPPVEMTLDITWEQVDDEVAEAVDDAPISSEDSTGRWEELGGIQQWLGVPDGADDGVVVAARGVCEDAQGQQSHDELWLELKDGEWTVVNDFSGGDER